MIRVSAVFLAFTLLLGACGGRSGPESVRAPDIDPGQWQTFQWKEDGQGVSREKQAREVVAVVRQAAVEAMKSKGYRQVAQSPDIVIRHHVVVEMRSEVVDGRRKPGEGWMNPPWEDQAGVRDVGGSAVNVPIGDEADQQTVEVPSGTLIIDVLDGDGHLLWRGWQESAVDLLAIAQPELDEVVREILARFPE